MLTNSLKARDGTGAHQCLLEFVGISHRAQKGKNGILCPKHVLGLWELGRMGKAGVCGTLALPPLGGEASPAAPLPWRLIVWQRNIVSEDVSPLRAL